jgi:hypothetical protein
VPHRGAFPQNSTQQKISLKVVFGWALNIHSIIN